MRLQTATDEYDRSRSEELNNQDQALFTRAADLHNNANTTTTTTTTTTNSNNSNNRNKGYGYGSVVGSVGESKQGGDDNTHSTYSHHRNVNSNSHSPQGNGKSDSNNNNNNNNSHSNSSQSQINFNSSSTGSSSSSNRRLSMSDFASSPLSQRRAVPVYTTGCKLTAIEEVALRRKERQLLQDKRMRKEVMRSMSSLKNKGMSISILPQKLDYQHARQLMAASKLNPEKNKLKK